MFLDVNQHHTLVELPAMDKRGIMHHITLTDWVMAGVLTSPYFQIKFSHGFEVETLNYGGGSITNAIQVPWPGTGDGYAATPKEVPVIRELMIPRVFHLEIFDSEGKPLTPERCMLWFIIEYTRTF